MAYYIDETKKTAVKMEGRSAFAWNERTHRFDLPFAELSPKSRMQRVSEFEAREYLFDEDEAHYHDFIQSSIERARKAFDPTIESALSPTLAEAEEIIEKCKTDQSEAESVIAKCEIGIAKYSLEHSAYGDAVRNLRLLFANNVAIAEQTYQIARLQAEIAEQKQNANE